VALTQRSWSGVPFVFYGALCRRPLTQRIERPPDFIIQPLLQLIWTAGSLPMRNECAGVVVFAAHRGKTA
jgi:hypothetical protein